MQSTTAIDWALVQHELGEDEMRVFLQQNAWAARVAQRDRDRQWGGPIDRSLSADGMGSEEAMSKYTHVQIKNFSPGFAVLPSHFSKSVPSSLLSSSC
jgi:hypothetical protein